MKKRILYFILTLIIAIIIFLFSSQKSKDSNNLSYSIDIKIFNLISKEKKEETISDSESMSDTAVDVDSTGDLSESQEKVDIVEPVINENENKYPVDDKRFKRINTVVRKTAHVTLYALFAISLMLFVKTYKIKNWKVVLIVIVVGFLYACLDEFNQKIRGTRSGIFSDCLIDTAGCLIGVCVVSCGEWIGKKWKENKGIE